MSTSPGTQTAAAGFTESAVERSADRLDANISSRADRSGQHPDRVPDRTADDFTATTAPTSAVRGQPCRAIADVDECIARFQAHGDHAALEVVMAEFDWLAVACARRLQRRGESREDLEQVAREGLLGAVARFDATRGTAFKSCAWATLLGSLRHYDRSRWQVRVPRGLQEMNLAALRAIEELTAAAGRAPTVEELAAHLNTDCEDVLLALDVGHAYRGEPIDCAPDEHEHASREWVLGYVDEALESVADRVDLRGMRATLPPVQRKVLVMLSLVVRLRLRSAPSSASAKSKYRDGCALRSQTYAHTSTAPPWLHLTTRPSAPDGSSLEQADRKCGRSGGALVRRIRLVHTDCTGQTPPDTRRCL